MLIVTSVFGSPFSDAENLHELQTQRALVVTLELIHGLIHMAMGYI